MPPLVDLTSKRFGRLLVLRRGINDKNNNTRWICSCDCGQQSIVLSSNLIQKYSLSCGCMNKEKVIEASTKHGLYKHRLYSVWTTMLKRCCNKNYHQFHNYGGRGITVCNKWKNNFKIFYDWATTNGWKLGLQIDRINNDGNYTPSNCRFVTSRENCSNQRTNSKYGVGVYKRDRATPFYVRVKIGSERIHVGSFTTAPEARTARKKFLKDRGLF